MLIQGYSDLEISTPDCMPGITIWTAGFKLEADVSSLFPYINTDIATSAYYVEHPCIIFELDSVKWSLYSDRASGLPFEDKDQAMGSIQRLIDYLNELDQRKDTIEPSYEVYKPVPVLDIFNIPARTKVQVTFRVICFEVPGRALRAGRRAGCYAGRFSLRWCRLILNTACSIMVQGSTPAPPLMASSILASRLTSR